MAIENIGLYPITIDVYKKHKETTVQANDNDSNGRGLLITLVKDGVPFNSSGINLKIGFRNAVGEERLYDCDTVNASEGRYKVFYPTEMLQGNGGRVVKLEIKAFEASGALLNYAPIFVYVSASEIPNDSIGGGNELSTLVNALSQVQDIDNRFGEVDAQLAQIAINVKAFGAVGDGVTDDTISFQQAFNHALETKRKVYIPDGVYNLNKLFINGVVKVEGSSKENTVLNFIGTGTFIKIGDETLTNSDNSLTVYGSTFKNLSLKTSDKSDTTAISVTRLVHSIFKEIRIDGFHRGMYIFGNDNDTTVGNSVFNNVYDRVRMTNCNIGFDLDGVITDSQFLNCLTTSIRDYAVHIRDKSRTSWNVLFQGCTFAGNKLTPVDIGVFIDNVNIRNYKFISCDFENIKSHGLYVKDDDVVNTILALTIMNNTFIFHSSATGSAIKLERGNNCAIKHNVISGDNTGGVDIELTTSAVRSFISGNVHVSRSVVYNVSETNSVIKHSYKGNQNVTQFERGVSVLKGDFVVEENGKGLVLNSPNGTRHRIMVSNEGTIYVYQF